ncbi:helix-turn-helix domain-containing protein [Marinoscillum sp.]|uniref:helix-turn-helix domain-containing protein n=1 Tax=Marinoscillum sp. TaxID=2024838 RepID=UPI003BA8A7EC
MAENTTYHQFIQRYIRYIPSDVNWQTTPLQVYVLERMSEHLVLPTPLLKADYYHLVYLNKGSFLQQIGIEQYTIKAPAMMFIAEGEPFALKQVLEQVKGFVVLMDKRVVQGALNSIDLDKLLKVQHITRLTEGHANWVHRLLELLHQELASSSPSRGVGNGLFQALLHRLITLSEDTRETLSRSYQVASQFKQLLNEYVRQEKVVAFYAKKLHVSENYLNRCVKATYDRSCKQVIQETAILQSQVLMFESRKDISEISYLMGFESPSYFSRVFKKVTDQTPTQFRESLMHGLS